MDDPTVIPTKHQESSVQSSQQSIQESQPLHNQYNENNEICSFCNVILYGGMDDNNLMHCQGCHRIWDGNAQCPCDFYND